MEYRPGRKQASQHVLRYPRRSLHCLRTIKVPSLFTSYRIESKADNTITVLLSPGALLAALRVTAPSSAEEDVEMKLVKKNNSAALNFEVGGMTRTGYRVRASYDVRVDVLMPEDADLQTEPQYPETNVRLITSSHRSVCLTCPAQIYIALPPLQKLRAIVERMRSALSDDLLVRASGAGRLVLGIDTDSVVLNTTWTDCSTPIMGASLPLFALYIAKSTHSNADGTATSAGGRECHRRRPRSSQGPR